MGQANVDALVDRLVSWSHEVVAGAAQDAVDAIRVEDAPYREHGSIREALTVESVTGHATGASATIAARTPEAKWTDEGTDPHMIFPVRARMLRFEVGGQVVFARAVAHPGNRPFNWWRPAVEWHGAEALRRRAISTRV